MLVTYSDGTKATVEQEAHDVATFLAWASDPKMEERKRMGFGVLVFLVVLSGLLFAAYRKVVGGPSLGSVTPGSGHSCRHQVCNPLIRALSHDKRALLFHGQNRAWSDRRVRGL